MAPYKSITIITSPYHVGIKNHRVGRGPQALLDAGLLNRLKEVSAGLPVEVVEIEDVVEVKTQIEGDVGRSFAVLRNVSNAVSRAVQSSSWPLVLSGNCMGVVGVHTGLRAGVSDAGDEGVGEREQGEVIWFDAHGDLETENTTSSGYLDGQGGSMLLGDGFGNLLRGVAGWDKIQGTQLVGVGWRDLSGFEKERVKSKGVRVVNGGLPIDQGEYVKQLEAVLKQSSRVKNAVLHLDVDSLDTSVGWANDFAVEGGLGTKDLLQCVQLIVEERNIQSMHVGSFDPGFAGSEAIAEAAVATIVSVATKVVQ